MPPLVLLAIAWIAGLLVAHHRWLPSALSAGALALFTVVPLMAMLLRRRDRTVLLAGGSVVALLLGASRYQMTAPRFDDPHVLAHYNEAGWVTIEGTVDAYPDIHDARTELEVAADWIEIDGQRHPVTGTVLATAPRYPEYRYGDRLSMSGMLKTPPEFEGFAYRDYLGRKRIYSVLYHPRIERITTAQGSPFWTSLFAARSYASGVIAHLMPEPEAALLQGIVLGVDSNIPADLYEAFNATSTSHVLVISGANLVVVSALLGRSFGRWLGKRRAFGLTMAGLTLYVLFVGAEAPVVRAAIMAGLYLTARYLGRHSTAYVSLCVAAVCLTAANPLAAWDAGFQLSFAAALGLILFAPSLEHLSEHLLSKISHNTVRGALNYVSDWLVVTLAAQILTLPVVAYTFGRLSLVSPLSNLLIAPVQPPIMIWGGAATLVGLVPWLEPIARVLAWIPWLCLAYTHAVVEWLASWRFASVPVGRVAGGWLALCLVIGLLALWVARRRKQPEGHFLARIVAHWPSKLLLGVMLAAAVLVWLAARQAPDGDLHVAFLDVGEGDAILITTPSGQQILVDGGPEPTSLASALGKQMPFWDRSLDLLIASHSDSDHLTGLCDTLRRFRVGGWMDAGHLGEDPTSASCQANLAEAHVPRHAAVAGDTLDLGGGLVLEVLNPALSSPLVSASDLNDSSVVLRLVYGQVSFLLTGDITAQAETALLQQSRPLSANVLKVAHHGSAGSSTTAFLAAVDPSLAVISVGADNPNGHPAPIVLERLAQQGDVAVLRTDLHGTIEFVSDGKRLWVQAER